MQDLTWWQGIGLVVAAAAAWLGGRILGGMVHSALYRRVLLAASPADDRFLLRLVAPLQLVIAVVAWQLAVSLFELAPAPLETCRTIGHIGLLVALAWGVLRAIDAVVDLLVPHWVIDQRAAKALVPLARRFAKVVVGSAIALMVLARLGFETGPLLLVFGIAGGALALAAVRPLENVLAGYAIIGDHGIREGDTVRLDGGVSGVIESIGLYSTRIRTADSSHVIVPNRKLADAQIERAFHRPATREYAAVTPPQEVLKHTHRELS